MQDAGLRRSRNWAHTLVEERATTKDQAQKLDVRIETYLKSSRRSMWIVTVDLNCLSWHWYDVTAPLLLSRRGCPRAGCTWLDYVRRRRFHSCPQKRTETSKEAIWLGPKSQELRGTSWSGPRSLQLLAGGLGCGRPWFHLYAYHPSCRAERGFWPPRYLSSVHQVFSVSCDRFLPSTSRIKQ